uniref:E3 ubiquitin-protein ligase n=1 Tax=Tetraselmis sp. GSL018 TaxID=582737 RepID=A0A061S2X3_9CHLO
MELLALGASSPGGWRPMGQLLAEALPTVHAVAVCQAAMAAAASRQPGCELVGLWESVERTTAERSSEGEALLEATAVQLLPLLRRMLALRALLCGDPDPPSAGALAAAEGGASSSAEGSAEAVKEFRAAAAALGLPPACEAIASVRSGGRLSERLRLWCARLTAAAANSAWEERPPVGPLRLPPVLRRPSLLPLPKHYHHLFLGLSEATCDVCGACPSDPALCLATGAILCCDEHTGCLSYAWQFGAGTGVFLLLKVTRLLVVRTGERACNNHPSMCIYLDDHGEADPWMQRGRALYLSKRRYELVSSLWSSAALDYDTSILFASFLTSRGPLHPVNRWG